MKYSKKLKKLIDENTNIKLGKIFIKEEFTNLLISETSFIKHDNVTKMERVWYVRNDIHEQVKCPTCGKPTKYNTRRKNIVFCSRSCVSNFITEDGLTIAQKVGKKSHETLSKVNPETGLTGRQENGRKIKATKSKVNPETGLTTYQENGLKAKETLSKVNPETGLTTYQENGLKIKESLSKVNPETGLTIAKERGNKLKETLSKINPETGITIAKERGIKSKTTKSKVNPITGLTTYQEIGLKAKETLSKVNPETGLTKFQENGFKSKIFNRNKGYKIIKNNITHDYTLLTTNEEYLNNEDFRFIKYQHSCGEIRESYWPYVRCLKCYPHNSSIAEIEVLEYCKTFTNNVISNDRQLIKPKELDIVLPDFNLAIEYDGLFWHSSYSIETEAPEYHLSKTQQCMENGYQLFHIFENEWEDSIKKDIWKSIISNKLGQSERIYARKCEIRNVDTKEVKTFLETNHLQGYVPSSINLGLFYQDELVSLMTFGKSRYGKKYDWELLRFCNKKFTSVIGGASKLFKNFTKSNKGIVVSYADMRRSNGNLYDKLGFELSHVSEPNYWYFKRHDNLESRIKYQKHKLSGILEEYDDNLTESENMYNNGFRKIYDCGNQVWVYS